MAARPPRTASTANQRPRDPTAVLAEAEEQWLFTEQELAHTPSIQDGMALEEEKALRAKGINFIRSVGIMLKLPELTLSTAAIFFNRFLMRMSLKDRKDHKALHHYTLGAVALFVATKVEECTRKLKDIVIACCRVAQKKPNLVVDEQSKDFWRWRDTILMNEDVLLEVLCFDLTIELPHKQLFSMLKFYNQEHNKPLRNAAWAFVTDGNSTQVCLLCSSRTIAAAALYAAARLCDVKLEDSTSGRPWWDVQGVRLQDMLKAVNYMCENYEHAPVKIGTENGNSGSGGNSIYVGLRTPITIGANGEVLLVDGREDEEPIWERTRLKSEQTIATPLQPTIDLPNNNYDNSRSDRAVSTSSQGSKRARDDGEEKRGERKDGEQSRESDSKRLKTENGSKGHVNGSTVDQPIQSVTSAVPAHPQDDEEANGSEEGEVEE